MLPFSELESAGQLSQLAALPVEYSPSLQSMQAVCSAPFECFPAPHGEQLPAPTPECLPSLQSLQPLWSASACLPGAHASQIPLPLSECFPSPQVVQLPVPPVE